MDLVYFPNVITNLCAEIGRQDEFRLHYLFKYKDSNSFTDITNITDITDIGGSQI